MNLLRSNECSELGTKSITDFASMGELALKLVETCRKKDLEYGSSWKLRGGQGAFFTTWRKVDRLENMLKRVGYNVFYIDKELASTESLDDTIQDLICYLLLIQETREAIKQALNVSDPRRAASNVAQSNSLDEFDSGEPTSRYVDQD